MPTRMTRWGGLRTQVMEPADPGTVRWNMVLSHGYGAPGEDLVPLAPLIVKFDRSLQDPVRFIFPEAPLDLAEIGIPGGRAWWHINMWRLQQAVAQEAYRDLIDETPSGLPEAREQFLRFLAEAGQETGIPLARTVLGGFSQGAMLSTEVALQLPVAPGGLIILSGTIMQQRVWQDLLAHRANLPVFQSDG